MIDLRIFVASCGSAVARGLVESLTERLRAISDKEVTFDLVVEPWFEVGLPTGKATLDGLIQFARKTDFSITVFTRDDLVYRGGSFANFAKKPRDNVVFEAGLFMGGLGLDTERNFLLSSVRDGALFTDLDGITFIPLAEPRGREREKKLDKAAEKIRNLIVKAGPFIRHGMKRMKKEDVFEREKPQPSIPTAPTEEYLDANSSVVICSNDPLEGTDASFSNTVFTNISSRIRYEYFFPAEAMFAHRLVSLVFRLLTHHASAIAPEDIKAELENDQNKLLQAERNLRKLAPYLTVHLMPDPPAFRFCVHNAEIEQRARCYLRHEKDDFDFVVLKQKQDAKKVATQLLAIRQQATTQNIFSFITHFTNANAQKTFRAEIEEQIKSQFPHPLVNEVTKACFA